MTKRRKKNILDAPLTPALKNAARELIEIQEAAKIKSVKSPHPWTPADGFIVNGEKVFETETDVVSTEKHIPHPALQKYFDAMEEAGELPIGMGGTWEFEKWKQEEKHKYYMTHLTWKIVWAWIKGQIRRIYER